MSAAHHELSAEAAWTLMLRFFDRQLGPCGAMGGVCNRLGRAARPGELSLRAPRATGMAVPASFGSPDHTCARLPPGADRPHCLVTERRELAQLVLRHLSRPGLFRPNGGSSENNVGRGVPSASLGCMWHRAFPWGSLPQRRGGRVSLWEVPVRRERRGQLDGASRCGVPVGDHRRGRRADPATAMTAMYLPAHIGANRKGFPVSSGAPHSLERSRSSRVTFSNGDSPDWSCPRRPRHSMQGRLDYRHSAGIAVGCRRPPRRVLLPRSSHYATGRSTALSCREPTYSWLCERHQLADKARSQAVIRVQASRLSLTPYSLGFRVWIYAGQSIGQMIACF